MALQTKYLLLIAFAFTAAQAMADGLANGATTTIGRFDPGSTGLIFGATATPELSTIALIGLGVILLVSLPRLGVLVRTSRNLLRQSLLRPSWIVSTFIAAIVCSPAKADSVAITYSLTGTGTVVGSTDTTLTLDTEASGSIVSGNPGLNAAWNPISYSELCVLDFTTNLLQGNFTITFQDGDTLTGTDLEDDTAIDNSPTQTGAFPQTLTFTGGTGGFAGATGSVSGEGFLGTTDFTVSGSGTVNTPTAPEPASAALLIGGLALLIVSWRSTVKKASKAVSARALDD